MSTGEALLGWRSMLITCFPVHRHTGWEGRGGEGRGREEYINFMQHTITTALSHYVLLPLLLLTFMITGGGRSTFLATSLPCNMAATIWQNWERSKNTSFRVRRYPAKRTSETTSYYCASTWHDHNTPVMKSWIAAIRGSPFRGVTRFDFTCSEDRNHSADASCDSHMTHWLHPPPSEWVPLPLPLQFAANASSFRRHQSQRCKGYTHIH